MTTTGHPVLRPLLQYHRANPADFYYTAPHPSESFAIPSVPGYVYQGIAFMVSTEPATMPDGTALIPFYEKQLPTGEHFYTIHANEGPAGTTTITTYYVFPNGTTAYGAEKINRCVDFTIRGSGNLHFYGVDRGPDPSESDGAWEVEAPMGCAIPIKRVHVSLDGDVVSTNTIEVNHDQFGGVREVPDGDVNIYPSRGAMLMFERKEAGYDLDTLLIRHVGTGEEWTFSLKEVSSAEGCPFRVVGTWRNGEGAYLVDEHDEGAGEDHTYEYTVSVRRGTEVFSHDPKVINRSGTTTAPINHR